MSKYEKIQIAEVIVVEGKDDTRRIQEVVDADTIETIGSAINEEILQRIELAEETRGVIVFTDPDFSGEKIRKIIMERIPTVKHAFISRKDGEPEKKGSLGVEHASDEAIKTALQKVVTPTNHRPQLLFDESLLIHYGLLSGKKARSRREKLGNDLRIGYTNGKQLKKRLAMFSIDESMLNEAMEKIWRDETNE